jgi:hypothetical protein
MKQSRPLEGGHFYTVLRKVIKREMIRELESQSRFLREMIGFRLEKNYSAARKLISKPQFKGRPS